MIGAALSALSTPAVRYTVAGVAALTAVAWLRHDAAQDARAEAEAAFRAEMAAAREEARQRAAEAASEVARIARRQRARDAAERQEIKERADALREELDAARSRGECRIPDDVLDRLRAIR